MLADLILLVHFALAAFIVLALPLVWIGAALDWSWIRNRSIRYAHLVAILVVAAEALTGSVCPLTRWEDALRASTEGRSFVGRWLGWLLYYDFPEWSFTIAYVLYAAATVATLRRYPPRRPSRSDQ
ncbi:MAG: DUF2784 domain-containing protein [Pseudomonadota bacterium]